MSILGTSSSAFKELAALRFFQWTFGGSFGLLLLHTGFLAWRLLPVIYGREVVPLHYNIHIGVDQVGAWWQIFTIPVLGLVFFLVNVVVALFLWRREPVLSHIFAAATLVLHILLIVTSAFTTLLVVSYG